MKMRIYWSYATRSLVRGGQRSLLAIFCVAVGVMAIVALQLVGNAINAGLVGNIRALNGGDVAISSTTAPLSTDQLSYFDQLKTQGTLTTYTAVANLSGQIHMTGASLSRFLTVDVIDPAQFPLEGGVTFTHPTGATLGGVLHNTSVVLTATMAQTLSVTVGATAQVNTLDGRTATETVGGIVQDAGLIKGSLLLIDRAAFAALPSVSSQPFTYNAIYAEVPGHTDANATNAEHQIQQTFPLATIQTPKQASAGNQTQVQEIQYFLQIVGLLALLIGGVGIVNTMQVLLRRRRVEIAMLKTSGYRQRDLYVMFGLEAGLIGLLGGIVGTAAGAGVSFLVKGLVEQSIQLTLPTAVDPQTLGAGVAVGFFTALIFGLMPIIQASQIRPLGVLRELPEGAGWRGRIFSAGLAALLVVLFFVLALSILRNVSVALYAVGGTGLSLALLSVGFSAVVLVIGRLPVLESFRWWYVAMVGAAILVAIALTAMAPAFGILCLIVTPLGIVVVLLPRAWKANVKLALRNIGRQRARTVTTLLALYIGIFTIGLILVLEQNIQSSLKTYIATSSSSNAVIMASSTTKAAVEQQIAQLPDAKHVVEASYSQAVPTAIDGQPVAQIIQTATAGGKYSVNDVTGTINGVQGYDLAHGQTPNPSDLVLTQGSHDTQMGRMLSASDADTLNALLPMAASQAPSNLKLGDTITVMGQTTKTPVTLTIVGFYTAKGVQPPFAPMLGDGGVVNTLSGSNPQVGFTLHLDPKTTDATLAHIQDAVPGVITLSIADFVDQYAGLLNNLVVVLVAVASLTIIASLIIIANTVALAMLERRRELGILKAVGYTGGSALGEVLLENGIVGFTGGFSAMLVVGLLTIILGKAVFGLPLDLATPTVLGIVATATLICMAVAASVAWGATRLRPLSVLRYEYTADGDQEEPSHSSL